MSKKGKYKGIGGHQNAAMQTDVWLTPPSILKVLGDFDLDPCSPEQRPWDTAKTHYTKTDNGLLLPWFGRVWLNPPYGREIEAWMKKMANHQEGIALIFARTDTQFFHQYIFPVADSLLFMEGRINFYNAAGQRSDMNAGAPSVLISYGEQNLDALDRSGIKGKHVLLNRIPVIVVGISPSWQSVVRVALTRLNGEGHTKKIYELVEQIVPDKVRQNEHYKEKIRQQLQMHFQRIGKGKYSIN